MRVIVGSEQRGPLVSTAAVLGSLAVLAVAVAQGEAVQKVAPVFLLVVAIALFRSALFRWSTLLYLLLLVILFIPIQRYKLSASLPVDLEPYRIVVGFIIAGWFLSLLVDPRVRLRKGGLERPIGLFALACLASEVANPGRVAGLSSEVVKTMSFMASFILVYYFIVSVVRTKELVDTLIKILVACGAIIAVLATIEARTGFNPFSHLSSVMPFLHADPNFGAERERLGSVRAYGPAQHPIALGAALVMLLPLGAYLGFTTRKVGWWLATLAITIGAVSTMSRTSIVMLIVVGVVFLWLRPREAKRCWPALILVAVAVHFAMPGALGTVQELFFPKGGLIQDQRASAGSRSSAGRVADLHPAFQELSRNPLLGEGLGTRITVGPEANAALLDDQWLKTLLETGILGALAFLWIIARFVRRAGRIAKTDYSPRGWCLAAIVASVTSFAFGMALFDAFSFIQVTFFFFIVLALGSVMLKLPSEQQAHEPATA